MELPLLRGGFCRRILAYNTHFASSCSLACRYYNCFTCNGRKAILAGHGLSKLTGAIESPRVCVDVQELQLRRPFFARQVALNESSTHSHLTNFAGAGTERRIFVSHEAHLNRIRCIGRPRLALRACRDCVRETIGDPSISGSQIGRVAPSLHFRIAASRLNA